uniref:Uncharacterized protein n=1 Tax=Picea sitchensis TaxID=3332 RepID=A0A6B9XU27_PICSI|nr:hypothetical protein Q903MT_gene3893 [Picea sitchensis]
MLGAPDLLPSTLEIGFRRADQGWKRQSKCTDLVDPGLIIWANARSLPDASKLSFFNCSSMHRLISEFLSLVGEGCAMGDLILCSFRIRTALERVVQAEP